jgi:hypothetical protein
VELSQLTSLLFASLVLVAFAIPVCGQTNMPREHTFQRSVETGQELHVFTYTEWHRDCAPMDPPRIVLRASPAHGTASLRPGPTTVTFVREGEADCTGKTYQGLGVWYVPAAGFRGIDQFDWDVIGSGRPSHDTAIVEVK